MDQNQRARSEFWRMMRWIVGIALVAVVVAIAYLGATGDLTANLVIATGLGVFFTVVVGCGLLAVSFLSSKGGHDEAVSDATKSERERT
ncbi:MAG TPA: hypothetical protein VFU80_00460 [Sphingomicrobium sp.]|nr:hypothetical protein [Sphingomicrobium sp.]